MSKYHHFPRVVLWYALSLAKRVYACFITAAEHCENSRENIFQATVDNRIVKFLIQISDESYSLLSRFGNWHAKRHLRYYEIHFRVHVVK